MQTRDFLKIAFKFFCFSLVISAFHIGSVKAGGFDIPNDKRMHLGVSAASHVACSVITEVLTDSKWGSKIGCWMAVNAAGVIKEITDPLHNGNRDVTDVYANMTGSGISFATLSIAF